MIDIWFQEGLSCMSAAKLFTTDTYSVIYKGFKIERNTETGEYNMYDVRVNDFYSKVSEGDLKVIMKNGFILGCDLIMRKRDEARVKSYTKKLEKLYTNKKLYEKSPKGNEKRLRNCLSSIADNIDLLFFYKTRLTQNKNKNGS